MPSYQFRVKPHPGRPQLNRARGLFKGLLFASSPGFTNGYTAGTFQTDYEDVRRQRGIFNTTVPNASPWQGGLGTGGRGIDNGDGSFNSVPEWVTGVAGDTRYDITFGFTACCLIRPDVLTTDGTLPFFKHMNQPYNGTTPGWCFTGAAGNLYRFQMSDGVNQRNVNSTTVQDIQRGHFVLATLLPTATGITVQMYVNGVLEGTQTSAVIFGMGNPANTPVKFLGLGTAAAGQPAFSGLVSMGAVWNRVLTPSEITRMAGDPFILWRGGWGEEDLAGVVPQTFLLAF